MTPQRVKIGYVGGGSTKWAHQLMSDLALRPDMSGEVALYDIDDEAAALNARFGNWVDALDETESDWTYEAYESREEALSGADFVVISTQDSLADNTHDLTLPEEYGVFQTVWDTVGPGGAFRAMRMVPQYRDIAASIRESCPDAWVINYSNPMSVCTRALYEEFPDINGVGLCHEIFGVQRDFADLVAKHHDVPTPEKDEIDLNVKGVNHFTWIDRAQWNDHDLFELLDREVEERGSLPTFEPGYLSDDGHGNDENEVTYELYKRFGVVPAAGDRHLVEFVPWFFDIEDREEIHRWGIKPCPIGYRQGLIDGRQNPLDNPDTPDAERYMNGDEEFVLERSGEEAVDIMRSLAGLDVMKTNVNVPNRGQMSEFPEGVVVETNALITADSVTPLVAGDLPRQVRSMVMTHVNNHETLVEAGFVGDFDLAFQAFINDPLVNIQLDEARDLFTRAVDEQRQYLDEWDFEGADVLSD